MQIPTWQQYKAWSDRLDSKLYKIISPQKVIAVIIIEIGIVMSVLSLAFYTTAKVAKLTDHFPVWLCFAVPVFIVVGNYVTVRIAWKQGGKGDV